METCTNTPGPPPLPKSATSTTLGCADLPAPPPPSHSPDHGRKVRAFMQRLGKSKRSSAGQPFLEAPTPLSKDGSEGSISTYPTLSAHSEIISSAPVTSTLLHPDETMKDRSSRWYRDGIKRPKSAGAGSNRSPCSSRGFDKSLASTPDASRESFIVFSVRKEGVDSIKGEGISPRRPSTADASTRQFGHRVAAEESTLSSTFLTPSPLRKITASSPQLFPSSSDVGGEDREEASNFYNNQAASESSLNLKKLRRFLPVRKRSDQSEVKEDDNHREVEDEMEDEERTIAAEGSQSRHHHYGNIIKVSTVAEEIDGSDQAYDCSIRDIEGYDTHRRHYHPY